MMTDYTPIDCGHYSEYELAILHCRQLRISWHEPGGQAHIETLRPVDLKTLNHEEFLIAKTMSGDSLQLRLDYIFKFDVI
jgi:Rho-binding antiterminator